MDRIAGTMVIFIRRCISCYYMAANEKTNVTVTPTEATAISPNPKVAWGLARLNPKPGVLISPRDMNTPPPNLGPVFNSVCRQSHPSTKVHDLNGVPCGFLHRSEGS
jgi:hypothetical protein